MKYLKELNEVEFVKKSINKFNTYIFEKNIPTDKKLWDKALSLAKGTNHGGKSYVIVNGERHYAPNDGKGYEEYPSAYCVPKDNSKALTLEGWKSYDELKLNDTIASYDILNDEIVFTEILNLHEFDNQDIYLLKSNEKNYKYECTYDHKVVFSYLKDYDNDLLKEKYNTLTDVYEGNMTYSKGRELLPDIENYVKKYGGKDYDYFISNSKNNVPKLRKVSELPEKNGSIIVTSKIKKGETNNINGYIKYETNPINMVLSMSEEQMLSFLYGSILCDGWEDNNEGKISYGFRQKNKDNLEAVKLAAFLTGHSVYQGKTNDTSGCTDLTIINNRHIGCDRISLLDMKTKKDVWCPETKYGTWIMKQDDLITITGNSNSYAAKIYKEWGGEWKIEEDLRDWHEENWVRIDTQGEIQGECGTMPDDQYMQRCLPKKKAESLTKAERRATVIKKIEGDKEGKQFVKNTKKAEI